MTSQASVSYAASAAKISCLYRPNKQASAKQAQQQPTDADSGVVDPCVAKSSLLRPE